MKKSLFLLFSLAAAFTVNAQQYFFTPEGNGDGDGSSWENAAAGEYLGATITSAEPGTEFYLMEGNYAPDGTTNKWDIAQGVIIKGGYPTTMTGTDTNIDHSKAGQSVFSADLDGDGKGDNTDYAFVYVGMPEKYAHKENQEDNQFYKDVPLTEIWGVTFRDGARQDGKYWGNMLFAKHTKLDLHFCKFINNQAAEGQNNAAIVSWGSQLRVFDCVFEGNRGVGAGSAALLRARASNSSNKDASHNMLTLFERCEFSDNTCTGGYGGTVSVADCAGTLYMINCTVTGSSVVYGGAVALGGSGDDGINAPKAYLINNTIVDNVATRAGNWIGGGYRAGKFSTTYLANNIMVNPAEKDNYNPGESVVDIQWATAKYYSAGYNILGTFTEKADDCGTFVATDKVTTSATDVNTQEKIFGTATLADNGGFSNSFAPLAEQATSLAVADLQAAVAAWNMETAVTEVMDLTVDQRGLTRAATTMAGSIDSAAEVSSAIENVTINTIQDGIYYTLQGQAMGKDFNILPRGLYICNGMKFVK